MDCVNCGAPLPAKRRRCPYCNTLNDTDLRAIHANTKAGPPSERLCPRCEVNLKTVDLGVDGKFLIERCEKCLGIFFDPSELEALLDKSVSHVYEVDLERMDVLIEEEEMVDAWTVTYVKCPVCQKLMHRKSYGARSGVIVDTCKNHGVWLDGGELGKLLRWSKAGGQLHDEHKKAEQQRKKERQQRAAKSAPPPRMTAHSPSLTGSSYDPLAGLLRSVLRLLIS